jgi:hypothetical protein
MAVWTGNFASNHRLRKSSLLKRASSKTVLQRRTSGRIPTIDPVAQASCNPQYPWFDVVQGSDLAQGDIITGCPVLRPSYDAVFSDSNVTVAVWTRTGIILTQSCDLAARANAKPHASEVLFCPVYSQAEMANHGFFSRKSAWEEARKGRLPAYHVLNRCDLDGQERDFQLVDFSRVFTVEIALIRELAGRHGSRLRLNPPNREHLAQAFARFFMRVGLPVDVPPFR